MATVSEYKISNRSSKLNQNILSKKNLLTKNLIALTKLSTKTFGTLSMIENGVPITFSGIRLNNVNENKLLN